MKLGAVFVTDFIYHLDFGSCDMDHDMHERFTDARETAAVQVNDDEKTDGQGACLRELLSYSRFAGYQHFLIRKYKATTKAGILAKCHSTASLVLQTAAVNSGAFLGIFSTFRANQYHEHSAFCALHCGCRTAESQCCMMVQGVSVSPAYAFATQQIFGQCTPPSLYYKHQTLAHSIGSRQRAVAGVFDDIGNSSTGAGSQERYWWLKQKPQGGRQRLEARQQWRQPHEI